LKTEILALAVKLAEHFGIDHRLVIAIIQVESNFDPLAIRYENHWRLFNKPEAFAKIAHISESTERILQMCSIGVMQTMGAVARDFGMRDNLLNLTNPERSIYYGCKKLKDLQDKYKSQDDVIAAYNAGVPVVLPGGKYKNQVYVDKVKAVLNG
jgi:soluble lytic murein transglycosylase-like protein